MNTESLLIDTSVWIRILRGSVDLPGRLAVGIASTSRIAICGPIQLEPLSGRNDLNAQAIDSIVYRSQMIWVDPVEDFVTVGQLANTARKNGHTIRSGIDGLIARVAIRSGVVLTLNDKDYLAAAKVSPLKRIQWTDYLTLPKRSLCLCRECSPEESKCSTARIFGKHHANQTDLTASDCTSHCAIEFYFGVNFPATPASHDIGQVLHGK